MNVVSSSTPVVKQSEFVPSKFQQAGFDWVFDSVGTGKSAVMMAVAGSGKSTFLRELSSRISSKYKKILLLAFNNLNAKEGRERNTTWNCSIMTYHAYGNATIRRYYRPKLDTEGKKVETILKHELADNLRFLFPPVKKLISFCKSMGVAYPSNNFLEDLSMSLDLEFGENPSNDIIGIAYATTKKALIKSVDMVDTFIDFDDMVFLPSVLKLKPEEYPMIMADEYQDTNHAQYLLTQAGRSGEFIGVGDPYQSIYAFRGADSGAMQRLIDGLGATKLPLSISYRCPMAVGDLVRSKFPHIGFESPEWAKKGAISEEKLDKALDMMQAGDLIVSRVNASLPKIALALIRKGKTARIMGRDIGRTIVKLITDQKATSIVQLMYKLRDYQDKKSEIYIAKNRLDKLIQLEDQINTIMAIAEGVTSVDKLVEICNTLFSDTQEGITLGTVHKNKGREAKNVYISRPDLLPLPFVLKKGNAEDRQQEYNCEYVAITRALENLTYLQGE